MSDTDTSADSPQSQRPSPKAKPDRPLPDTEQREHFARAANEDDDGYDPWSDRSVEDPLWEENPWD